MDRQHYKSLASRLGWLGLENYDATLTAGKPSGSTHLDLGGECEVAIKHRNGDDAVLIDFKAEDRTKGTLTIPAEAFRESMELNG